ncbi:MAG TPA: HAMP domain-containing sensor histidine kinase, partial [Chloroflexota bacterium]
MRPSSNATDHAESLRLIGKLTAGLAHDLNQTLGLIAGYTELSLRQLPRDAASTDLRRYLELAHRTALDGSAMLSDILRFARGEARTEAESISLRELLTNVADLTSVRWRDAARAEGREIHLHVDADEDASVLGWRQGLQHMFMNLVFNAIDALPHGGSITLWARRIDELVEIRVIDTGVGMPPRVQQRIFEPFFTT